MSLKKYRVLQDGEYKGRIYRKKKTPIVELTANKDVPKHLFEEIKTELTTEEKEAIKVEKAKKKADEEAAKKGKEEVEIAAASQA